MKNWVALKIYDILEDKLYLSNKIHVQAKIEPYSILRSTSTINLIKLR